MDVQNNMLSPLNCERLQFCSETCMHACVQVCVRLEIYSFVCSSRTNGYCSNTRRHKRTHTNMHTRVALETSDLFCAVNDLARGVSIRTHYHDLACRHKQGDDPKDVPPTALACYIAHSLSDLGPYTCTLTASAFRTAPTPSSAAEWAKPSRSAAALPTRCVK